LNESVANWTFLLNLPQLRRIGNQELPSSPQYEKQFSAVEFFQRYYIGQPGGARMCATLNSRPLQTQMPLFCLQCQKLLILIPRIVFEVSDHAGVFLGYVHKNCLTGWEQDNPGSNVELLIKT
jgi:hypothetical protein